MHQCVVLNGLGDVIGVCAYSDEEPLAAALRAIGRYDSKTHGKTPDKVVVTKPATHTGPQTYKVFQRKLPDASRWPVLAVDE